jgi:RNA polymerase sigma factor (sigma-70 family)
MTLHDAHPQPLTDAPDEALLILYANGDPGAARVLAARMVPRTLGYATRLLGGDRAEAEDVAQEAMLRLWRVAPDWRPGEARVTTWLYRVVTNLCTDRRRGRVRRAETDLDGAPDMDDGQPGAEARLMAAERAAALQAALAELPERQRQAVILRHIEGLTNPEIAVVLEVGIEAVESLTARGKRALQAILAGRRETLGLAGEA